MKNEPLHDNSNDFGFASRKDTGHKDTKPKLLDLSCSSSNYTKTYFKTTIG